MGGTDVLEVLNHQFPGVIRNYQVCYENEFRCEVDPGEIGRIARFLSDHLKMPLVSLFASDERVIRDGRFAIYYLFTLRPENQLWQFKTMISEADGIFPSITTEIPAANLYERKIRDLYGLIPEGHPDPRGLVFHHNWPRDLYPSRRDYKGIKPLRGKAESQFTRVDGSGVYEIPVGPVHAGIIEPGHFRFSVAGEPIIHLEAQLHYVHKGIEKLAEGQSIEKCFYIAERISGDETFANSMAYCQAIERIAGVQIPVRAEYSRVVFAELERLVNHFGDLAGICTDVAYGFAASQFNMLRIWAYQTTEEMGRSRFLRSVNRIGGLRRDFLAGKEERLLQQLARMKAELTETEELIKANSLFVDRVEHTGILATEIARDLNAVGPAGRASGLKIDVRRDHPYAAYGKLRLEVPEHANGDVNCRMNVKISECYGAMDLITQALSQMPSGEFFIPIAGIEPYKSALGYTESPRGENIHWIMSGPGDTIFRYKIRTPSFCNWPALCYAVKGNIVPDFPLINKSFNLSYAGNDL
ncbi:MAG TPA: NADH-quinone oxidoreductase subunit C [Bacillota bacterium]